MKIDRLLGIVVYLLNREIVNANALAEKFEVSTRTIQRDIETLNLAGIPITSMQGMNGGYGIIDSFKLDKQIASIEDYQFIITALTGMNSAYNNRKLEATLEKLLNVYEKEQFIKAKVRLDFSVSREGNNLDEYLKVIEEYFPNASIGAKEDGDFIIKFHVPSNEIGWKGLIFTYGNKIKIIEPKELIKEFRLKAEEIIDTYK